MALPAVAVDPQGAATQFLLIPALPELLGQAFTAQWITAMPGANRAGLFTTQGLRATIGS